MESQSEAVAAEDPKVATDSAVSEDKEAVDGNGNEQSNEELMVLRMWSSDEANDNAAETANKTMDSEANDKDIVAVTDTDEVPKEDGSGDAEEVTVVDDKPEVIDCDDKEEADGSDCQVIGETSRMSTDEDIHMEVTAETTQSSANEETRDQNKETDQQNEVNEDIIDTNCNDSDLIIRGLKTSLMLSEEKNQKFEREKKDLEDELKKVYQHLFKSIEEKKTLQIKCQTLEEQIEKLVANSSTQKRPAQESPTMTKSPPKKIQQQNRPNFNANNDKKVRFRGGNEDRPHFGQFGARFRHNDLTPPPFPGPNAPEFRPPPVAYGQREPPPMGGFRGPPPRPMPAAPDMADIALTEGFQMISTVGNRLQLPASIVERAVRLFRQCYDSPLRANCHSMNQPMATACVFLACREEHCPQTFKTMCTAAKMDRKVLDQCLSDIISVLNIPMEESPSPGEVIAEFCARGGFSRLIQAAAVQIAKKAMMMNLMQANNVEAGAAAAILLASMASDEQRPVFELSYVTGVGDHAIRHNYNRLLAKARQLFPPNFPFITSPERLPLM